MNIRPARPSDYPAICALWNPLIRDTTTIFHSEERDSAKVDDIITARRRDGHEFFVAEAGGSFWALPPMPSSGRATAMHMRWNIRSSWRQRRRGGASGGP